MQRNQELNRLRADSYFAIKTMETPMKEIFNVKYKNGCNVVTMKWRWRIDKFLRAIWCRLKGHRFVEQRWVHDGALTVEQRLDGMVDGEVHRGCRRCWFFEVTSL